MAVWAWQAGTDAGPDALTRAHRAGHVTASALVVDEGGRVLLCLHGRLGL